MKNFLKSTAIFACIALMFCACSEDGTEDAGVAGGDDYIETFVESPTIDAVQRGNGIANLTFTTASDDDISKCVVAWVHNEDSSDSGSKTMSVDYDTQVDYTISGLKDGTYTISVWSIMDDSNKTSEPVTVEVTVYDETTYQDEIPAFTRMEYDSAVGITVYLDEVNADCLSLDISYSTESGDYSSTVTASVDITDPSVGTTLPGAKLGGSYSLVGRFMPEDGYDYVEVRLGGIFEATEDLSYPDGIAVTPGMNRAIVEWELSEEDKDAQGITATCITYTNTSDPDATTQLISYSSWDFESENIKQSYEISGLEPGQYTVVIYNYDGVNSTINSTTVSDVAVYDETSFVLPAISSILYKSDNQVYIDWGEVPESMVSLMISYYKPGASSATLMDIEDLTLQTTAVLEDGATEGSKVTVSAEYHPEGAIEEDVVTISTVSGEETLIPELIPVALSDVLFTMGYNETATTTSDDEVVGKSYLKAEWSALGDDVDTYSVNKVVVYYKDAAATTYNTFEVTSSLKTATSCKIEGLTAGVSYTGYIVTQKASGLESLEPSQFGLTAYDDSSYSVSDIPEYTVVTSLNDSQVLEFEVTWGDLNAALVSLTVTPNSGAAMTLTAEELAAAENKMTFVQGDATSFLVTATFKPVGDYTDEVVVANTEEIAIPLVTPDAITGVATTYGINDEDGSYITVTWDAPVAENLANITEYVIYYAIGTADEKSQSGIAADATTYTFSDIADDDLGTYTISVVAMNTVNGVSIESAKSESAEAIAYGVATYQYTNMPSLAAVVNGEELVIDWDTEGVNADLYSVTYTYGENYVDQVLLAEVSAEGVVTLADVTLDYTFGVETISLSAQYKPAAGEGTATVEISDILFSEPAPTAPTAIAVDAFGNNESDGAYATISWGVPESSVSTITKMSLYAVATDNLESKVGETTVDVAATTYTFQNLTAGKEYLFYVATQTENGVTSDYLATTETIKAYSASLYSLPTATAMCSTGTSGSTVTVDWDNVSEDLVSLTVTYGFTGDPSTYAEVLAGTTFTYSGFSDFTYAANFKPTGGADEVTLSGGAASIAVGNIDIMLIDDVYQIYTAKGLAVFADLVNGTQIYKGNSDISGFTYPVSFGENQADINGKLMRSIDLSEVCSADLNTNWTPIGTATYVSNGLFTTDPKPYSGTFNGGNCEISGLYIYVSGTDTSYRLYGLFGYVDGATIKNVVINNPYVYMNGNSYKYSGALAGCVEGLSNPVTISDCKLVGSDATLSAIGSSAVCGGFIGLVNGETNSVVIERCSNQLEGTMTTVGQHDSAFIAWVAGTVNLTECYNSMDMTGGNQYVGGLIGIGASSSNNNAGGVDLTLTACYNTGSVTSTSSSVGGLLGQLSGSSSNITLTGCYNTGAVTGGGDRTAGLLGGIRNATISVTFTSCYNAAAVAHTSGTWTTTGALFGACWSTVPTSSITDCYYLEDESGVALTGTNLGLTSTNTGDIASAFTDISTIISSMNASLTDYEYAADGTISAK